MPLTSLDFVRALSDQDTAVKLALREASHLATAGHTVDMDPRVVEVDATTYPGFIHVDIQYNTAGWCALYEYRISDGNICLAQS